jgi:hypothetical protein
MICGGCGNTKAFRTYSGNGWEVCDKCDNVAAPWVPDVYWDGTPEHGLSDDPKTGQTRVFGSKVEKAIFLKQNHLVEAGDRVKGSMVLTTRGETKREVGRADAEKALFHVKQMGRDYRRQEFLRIQKQARERQ